jgi:hypothetical protein
MNNTQIKIVFQNLNQKVLSVDITDNKDQSIEIIIKLDNNVKQNKIYLCDYVDADLFTSFMYNLSGSGIVP